MVNITYPVNALDFPFDVELINDDEGSVVKIACYSGLDCTHGVINHEMAPVPFFIRVRISRVGRELVDVEVQLRSREAFDDSQEPPATCTIGEGFIPEQAIASD